MKYYTIYKITNNIDGMIYIGKHITEDLNDNYMGSGTVLKVAQELYGIDNFTKEILFIFDNEDDMNNKEKEIVNEEFLKRDDVYNMNEGGDGGWTYINNNCHNNKHNKRRTGFLQYIDKGINPYSIWYNNLSNEEKEKYKKRVSEGIKKHYETHEYWWTGKHHSEETKKKLSLVNSENHKGELNGRYNTKWVYNIELRKCKVVPNDYSEDGWLDGRICGGWEFLDRCCSNCGKHLHLIKNTPKTLCDDCIKLAKEGNTRVKNCDDEFITEKSINQIKEKEEKSKYYTKLYEEYKIIGWNLFKEKHNITSTRNNYLNLFRKYAENYKA